MSLAVLLTLLLSGAPPAARAEALSKSDAETLFLEFGAVKAEDYPEPDRERVARALLAGAESARKDPMIALGLAEKAVQLSRSATALVLLASLEVEVGQRSAAAKHLEDALALKAEHVPALVARAELAVKEEDFAVAVRMYERALAAGAKAVKAPLEKARAGAAAKEQAVANLKRTEKEIKTRVADATRNVSRDWLKQILKEEEETSERKRLAPEGVRRQEMANFVFSYSAGSKLAGDMFAFESKVEKLLEKTYDFVADKLNHKLGGRTPVVLMTREEFAAKYAGTPMSRAAGFWDGKQIVINGGSTVDERFAQVMVHEFTHAVVTDLAGHGNPPRWFNEGLAENMRLSSAGLEGKPEDHARAMLSALKKAGRLPKLVDLDPAFAGMVEGVEVAYALAAQAAWVLVDKRGYTEYVDALREMKRSRPSQVIEKHWGSLADLDRAVADAI